MIANLARCMWFLDIWLLNLRPEEQTIIFKIELRPQIRHTGKIAKKNSKKQQKYHEAVKYR